jgi:hypothetical protein
MRADQLTNFGAKRLAKFILKLGSEVEGVDERIEVFLVSDKSEDAAQLAKQLTASLRRSRQFYGYARASELAGRLAQVLDIIDTAVLPVSPATALKLIVRFMEGEDHAFESADDSDGVIGDVFRRAGGLFVEAAKSLPSADTLPVLKQLLAEDRYGVRYHLLKGVGQFLDKAHLDAFISETQAQLTAGGEPANEARLHLLAIAESIRDPVLFEQATYSGRKQGMPPNVAIDVARHFLDAGRPREAFERLPANADGLCGFTYDYLDLKVRILMELGDSNALRAALWARFVCAPARDTFEEMLAAEPLENREARRNAALEEIRVRLPPQGQSEFFAEIGDLETCASIIMSAPENFNGDLYFFLVPMAERLEAAHPLAAYLVYRALLESILRRAVPKTYHHAARYWEILHSLGSRTEDWKGLEPLQAFRERIGREHARKKAFWAKVEIVSSESRSSFSSPGLGA